MNNDTSSDCSGLGSGSVDGRPNVDLAEGESMTLTPDSRRYGPIYKEFRPTRLAELQELIGVRTTDTDRSLQGRCCVNEALQSTVLMPEHLQDSDPVSRARADRLTYLATSEYLTGKASQLKAWEPVIDAWIRLRKPILQIAYLNDIVVANKATLTLSANTHALYAHTITIVGSGRINCLGPTKIKATSLEGRRFLISQTVAQSATAGSLVRS